MLLLLLLLLRPRASRVRRGSLWVIRAGRSGDGSVRECPMIVRALAGQGEKIRIDSTVRAGRFVIRYAMPGSQSKRCASSLPGAAVCQCAVERRSSAHTWSRRERARCFALDAIQRTNARFSERTNEPVSEPANLEFVRQSTWALVRVNIHCRPCLEGNVLRKISTIIFNWATSIKKLLMMTIANIISISSWWENMV